MLQTQSGARKVQVAVDSPPNALTRNVFVEGDRESVNKVKKMLQEIVETQLKLKNALGGNSIVNNIGFGKSTKMDVPVPDNLVGLIIGTRTFLKFLSFLQEEEVKQSKTLIIKQELLFLFQSLVSQVVT